MSSSWVPKSIRRRLYDCRVLGSVGYLHPSPAPRASSLQRHGTELKATVKCSIFKAFAS